jgi:Zn-dependent alcohol dehydrogenase
MITTRAAVLREMGRPAPYASSRPLSIETLQLAPPAEGELLIQVRAAGLCHSDLSVIDGSRPRVMPMVLGHEAAGVVEACGPGVTAFAPGDHVVFSFVPVCGHCDPCASGRAALCEPGAAANVAGSLLGGTRPFASAEGSVLHQHLGVSGFAERTVVSQYSAVKLPKDLPFDIAALFGCAVMTGVGAVVNTAQLRAGQSIAIFGLGGVGLAALLGAIAAGAEQVVAIDVSDEKLALASALGATRTVKAGPEVDVAAAVKAAVKGGVEFAIETVGHEAVLATAYAATRRGGCTITVGLPHPSRMLSLSAVSLVTEERTLKGSYMGSCVPSRDLPRFVALHRAGRLPVERLLTHRLRLEAINEGFDRLARGEAVRQVILFDA